MNTIEIHERLAAVVRAAIESTLNHLDSLHENSHALPLVVGHLGDLLEIEKRMMVEIQLEGKTEALWYPDDSGQWVESHGVDPELSDRLTVQVLSAYERDKKHHIGTRFKPSVVAWPCAAAYKVVAS